MTTDRTGDLVVLANDKPYIGVGLAAVEDSYREFQWGYRASTDTRPSAHGFHAAVEVVTRQVAAELGCPLEEANIAVLGYIYGRCGMYSSPRGLDEWNQSRKAAAQ
ncbi:hypothetical protein [Microbispora sp. NPDC049125]|uniref:hypothetical protein n=1 Tax=Microbispora sp. NPDC049125 TaxID=3154929 RepID=UPI003467852B